MGVKVPDTNTFSLQDVYNAVNDHSSPAGNLSDCFAKSKAGFFDAAYNTDSYAPANSMKRFRNYGGTSYLISIGSGTGNHWGSTCVPPFSNNFAWYDSVYDPNYADVVAGQGLATGYAGHHNSNIVPATTRLHRNSLEFDTSAIPDDAVITSASLRLYAAAHEHDLSPVIAPIKTHIVSNKDFPSSYIPFASGTTAMDTWTYEGVADSVGSFLCDDWSYKTYNISIDPDAIMKTKATWLTPRLMYWDYNYALVNDVPSYLRAIKFDASKTSANKPMLTIYYDY